MSSIIMSILTSWPIEPIVGTLAYNRRGRDSGLFVRTTTSTAFSAHLEPNITVSSPLGASGCKLPTEYGSKDIGGENQIPSLSWSASPTDASRIKEWLLVSEDPDAPTAEPIVHGLYYGIPASKTSVIQADFEPEAEIEAEKRKLKGGFCYGQNRRGTVYIPPRPLAAHGPHRYFFEVIGLSQKVDVEALQKQARDLGVGKEQMLKEIEGKVVGWGEWVGEYERK